MAAARIGCIVEGHGETDSVPILIRRIAESVGSSAAIIIDPVIRVPKSKLLKPGELERVIDLATRKTGASGGVLLLIDSDEDCPAELGPQLLQRARNARSDVPLAAVIAKREFEGWFLAAADSLRGRRGLPDTLASPDDPESVRDAKGWLRSQMATDAGYSPTIDQPKLASVFDLTRARSAPSFDKCYRDVTRLLDEIGGIQA